jgi:enamine deaminase RidA (YjgF/YER057c/UK114 family)
MAEQLRSPKVARRGGMVAAGPFHQGSLAATRAGGSDTGVGLGLGAMEELLRTCGAALPDVVRLWLWIPGVADEEEALREFAQEFPDPQSRPALSVVVKPELASDSIELECLAVLGAERTSISVGGQDARFPTLTLKNGIYCTSAIEGTDLESGELPAAPEEQASNLFATLSRALEHVPSGVDGLAHMLVWYRSHASRDLVNAPFVDTFPVIGDRPARHSVVRPLRPGSEFRAEGMGVAAGTRACHMVHGAFHAGIKRVPNSLPFGTTVGPLLCSAATYGRDAWLAEDGSVVIDSDPAVSVEAQAELAIERTRALLDGCGLRLADLVHVFVWVPDAEAARRVLDVWESSFVGSDVDPVMHVLETALPANFGVQFEVIAVRSDHDAG